MRSILIAALVLMALPVSAQEILPADDLVRLPGGGTVKPGSKPGLPDKLVPAGGLIASFDINGDARVDARELQDGARAAFRRADANADASLTALEQISWAASLPTRDDSLANPVRFDPNLDRSVSEAEFVSVIDRLAGAYRDEGSGTVSLARLEAPKDDAREERGPIAGLIRPRPTP